MYSSKSSLSSSFLHYTVLINFHIYLTRLLFGRFIYTLLSPFFCYSFLLFLLKSPVLAAAPNKLPLLSVLSNILLPIIKIYLSFFLYLYIFLLVILVCYFFEMFLRTSLLSSITTILFYKCYLLSIFTLPVLDCSSRQAPEFIPVIFYRYL